MSKDQDAIASPDREGSPTDGNSGIVPETPTLTEESVTVVEFPSKTISKTSTFMDNRLKYRVIENDIDVTPDNLIASEYVIMDDNFIHAAFDSRPRRRSDAIKHRASNLGDLGMKVYATTINLDDIRIDHTMNTEEGFNVVDGDLDKAPSAFCFPAILPIMHYPPSIFVILKETETQFFLDLPSNSWEKGTDGANIVEQENEYYAYITVGKGRNRKMVSEETQTSYRVTQTRHTMAKRPTKMNNMAFASMWDMHDTYAKLAAEQEEEEPDEMVMYQCVDPRLLRKKKKIYLIKTPYEQFQEIATSAKFQDAVLLTERVLGAIDYTKQQKTFRGLSLVNPLSLDLVYVYTMQPLWTLESEETAGRPISCVSFNPENKNILAAGYGKFAYAETFDGLICVWCTKNPCKPERVYHFAEPVTSMSFSTCKPNWLACGFANGDVLILDITSYPISILAKSKRDTNPCFEPIWSVDWRMTELAGEFVMATCQDGRISKFTSTKTHDFICTPMMRVTSVEGKTKGLEVTKACLKNDVPINRYPAALCMKWHTFIDHIYLVGTDEGCIHKCSTHYLNQHMDVWRAHAGPVYKMEQSPYMENLIVSCGADNAIRLWIDGIDDVIMTLTCTAAVYDVAFCPINSTLLISVSRNCLSIWDLRRKVHMPCTEHHFPTNVVLTYVSFSISGDNVFVADTTGRIHTFHLEDTPIPPYYQRKLLNDAIKKALCTRPQVLKQLKKLEQLQGIAAAQ